MDLQPSDFVLAQEQQGLIQEGKPVMCHVTSEHQFSSAIREEIKFAVNRRNAEGKQRVPTRQDLCSLSNDGKRFSFGFDTEQPGAYKVVVWFKGKNIEGSPCKVVVVSEADQHAPEPDYPLKQEIVKRLGVESHLHEVKKEKNEEKVENVENKARLKVSYNVNGEARIRNMEMLEGKEKIAKNKVEEMKAMEKVKKQLRSVLIPHKNGLLLDDVNKEYREMVGQSPDFRLLGFPSLEALLRSIPDVCSFKWFAGQLMVLGVANEATMHVQDMVAQQKGGKARRGGRGGIGRIMTRGSYRGGFQQPGNSHPPAWNSFQQPGNSQQPAWNSFQQVNRGRCDVYFGDQYRGGRGGFRLPPPFPFPGTRQGFQPGRGGYVRPKVPRRPSEDELPRLPGFPPVVKQTCGPLDLVARLAVNPAPFPGVHAIKEGVQDADLHRPIGLCKLQDGSLVVASTFENKVKVFNPDGQFVKLASLPDRPFERPSDMAALANGDFVVRDAGGVHIFSKSGSFQRRLNIGNGRSYGLAQDSAGNLVTIQEGKKGQAAALLFIQLGEDQVVRRRDLGDLVGEEMWLSKCRFLTHCRGKLYVTDLGLDKIYVINSASGSVDMVFGSSGGGPGCFSDPAGLGVDGVGGMVIADSKNHRVCLYSHNGSFVTVVPLDPSVRRPSGLLVDAEKRELYVLCLSGHFALIKYSLH